MRPFWTIWLGCCLILLCAGGYAQATQLIIVEPKAEATRLLPQTLGEFQMSGSPSGTNLGGGEPEEFGILATTSNRYVSRHGDVLNVSLMLMRSPGAAYSFLTAGVLSPEQFVEAQQSHVGTASVMLPDGVNFVRDNCYVSVRFAGPAPRGNIAATAFGRLLATSLGSDTEEIPVLVKHLPQAETAYQHAPYVVSHEQLELLIKGSQPLLDAITFNAGEEAAVANYGATQLLIVENNTPQLATEADLRIQKRQVELRNSEQSSPAVYRRIGNYSVFAFNAPDDQTAAQLLDQVAYEKTVSWLGDNPYILQRAQRNYTQMMGGVVLAVVQGAGLAILICLFIGGFFGGIVFLRRRKRQSQSTAFSDAGGMVRLNLDELTPQMDHSRLLDKGNG